MHRPISLLVLLKAKLVKSRTEKLSMKLVSIHALASNTDLKEQRHQTAATIFQGMPDFSEN